MARNAKGKKSYAISDRSGFKVRYTQLKTTWDNLRVEPEEFEPKHPQLTPAKNIIDATSLFNPRPDNDPENSTVFIKYNYDWSVDPKTINKSPSCIGGVGRAYIIKFEGNGATGGVGNSTLSLSEDATSSGGTGAVGNATPFPAPSGASGTGGVGSIGISMTKTGQTSSGGTGAVGNHGQSNDEEIHLSINETGLGGTGGVGSGYEVQTDFGWGHAGWDTGSWGK